MSFNGDLSIAELVIECGGVDNYKRIHHIVQTCARCGKRQFDWPAEIDQPAYKLGSNGTLELWECWKVVCSTCGMEQEIHTITIIPEYEEHPRRDMLLKATFVEE